MTKLMVVEWPDGLLPQGEPWERIVTEVNAVRPDILLTNEMPFGTWCPAMDQYDPSAARGWADMHERGIEALSSLSAGAVLSSRPVPAGHRLANEAFSVVDGRYTALHQKQLFPEEEGWHEGTWFEAETPGFAVHDVLGVRVAFLVCTELMFNEHARRLGRAGADLIAVPRATGLQHDPWLVAGRMAALVGGCYVASSNRAGCATVAGPVFGGHGFVVAPGGDLLLSTDGDGRMCTVELDLRRARAARQQYPCYVPDIAQNS